MRRRSITTFRPALERFEARQLLSAGSVARQTATPSNVHSLPSEIARSQAAPSVTGRHRQPHTPGAFGYLAFRVTNTPYQTPYKLVPPFQQVLVQGRKPVPRQVYNVTYVTVKNGTAQTFTSSDDFTVRMTNQPRSFAGFPILTGDQQWKPGQILVFYVLTKKYYAGVLRRRGVPVQHSAAGHRRPYRDQPGIFLRLKYNPATFARTLNWIVAFGQGNEAGQGAKFGLPNTAINEIVDARPSGRRRSPFDAQLHAAAAIVGLRIGAGKLAKGLRIAPFVINMHIGTSR